MAKFKFVFLFVLFYLVNSLQTASVRRDDEKDYQSLLSEANGLHDRLGKMITDSKFVEEKQVVSNDYYTDTLIKEHNAKISNTNSDLEGSQQCIKKANDDTVIVTNRYTLCEETANGDYGSATETIKSKISEINTLIKNMEKEHDACDITINPDCIKDVTDKYNEELRIIKEAIVDLPTEETKILNKMKTCYNKKFDAESLQILATLDTCIKENADKVYKALLEVANNSKNKLTNIKNFNDNFSKSKKEASEEYYTADAIKAHNDNINNQKIKFCTDRATQDTEEVLNRYSECEKTADENFKKIKTSFEGIDVDSIIIEMEELYKKCTDDKFPSCIKDIIEKHNTTVQNGKTEIEKLEKDANKLLPDMKTCYKKKFNEESQAILLALGTCVKEEPYIKLLQDAKDIKEKISTGVNYLENKYPGEKQEVSKDYYTQDEVDEHMDIINKANSDLQSSKAKPCIETATTNTNKVTTKYHECEDDADTECSSIKSSLKYSKIEEIISNIEAARRDCDNNDISACIENIVTTYSKQVQSEKTSVEKLEGKSKRLLSDMKSCFGSNFKTEAEKIITTLNSCIKDKYKEEITELQNKCKTIITAINTQKDLETTYNDKKNEIIKKFDTAITKHNKEIENVNGEISSESNAVLCFPKAVYQTSEKINIFKIKESETNSKSNITKIYIAMSENLITSLKEKIDKCLADNKLFADCIIDTLGYKKYIDQIDTDINTQSYETHLQNLENSLPNENDLTAVISNFKACSKKLKEGKPDSKLPEIKKAIETLQNIPTTRNFFDGYNGEINNILGEYDIPKAVKELEETIKKKDKEAKSEAKSCITDAKEATKKAKINSEKGQEKCESETKTDEIRENGVNALNKAQKVLTPEIEKQNKCFTDSTPVDNLVSCLGKLDTDIISKSYAPVEKEISDANAHSEKFKSCLKTSFIKKEDITDTLEKCIKDKNSASNIYANGILYFCSAVILLMRMI